MSPLVLVPHARRTRELHREVARSGLQRRNIDGRSAGSPRLERQFGVNRQGCCPCDGCRNAHVLQDTRQIQFLDVRVNAGLVRRPDFNATAGARGKFRRLCLNVSDLAIEFDRGIKAPQRDFAPHSVAQRHLTGTAWAVHSAFTRKAQVDGAGQRLICGWGKHPLRALKSRGIGVRVQVVRAAPGQEARR